MRSERMMLEIKYIIVMSKGVMANHKQSAYIKKQFLKRFGAIKIFVLGVLHVSTPKPKTPNGKLQENAPFAGKCAHCRKMRPNCRKMRQLFNFFLYLDLDHIKLSLDQKLAICKDCNMLMTKKHLNCKHKCKKNRKAEHELCRELANQL